jgi:hypothetical protein
MLEPETPDCDCSSIDSRRERLSYSRSSNSNLETYQNESKSNGVVHDSRKGASMFFQGLQASRRRAASGKGYQRSPGGDGADRCSASGMCRLSRGMRLRTQRGRRRKIGQRRQRSGRDNAGFGHRIGFVLAFAIAIAVMVCLVQRVQGFGALGGGGSRSSCGGARSKHVCVVGDCRRAAAATTYRMVVDDSEEEIGDDSDTSGILLDDLSWRVEKLRLEERNKERFLKAGPRFLPYAQCQRWVQAWGRRWESEEEWNDWIAMGEKRNAYIPSRPDEYYGRLGQWVSWEHFLGTEGEGDLQVDQEEE